MTLTGLLSLALLTMVGVASPGPDLMLVLRTGTRSRKHAIAATLGCHTSLIVWNVLTVVGAATLLHAKPEILSLIEICGGAFLLYLGQKMARAGWKSRNATIPQSINDALGTPWQIYRLAALTNISNPKAVLFMGAIIAPIIPPAPSTLESAAIVATLWLSSLLVMFSIAMFVSTKTIQRKVLGYVVWVDIIAGIFFIIVGAVLIIEGLLNI
ncbi:LysE family transporter [Corynebacterium caspium]|uniref:LysE family transporter n=1 Tax=Corynebacterium caspium TaxID=234828 RepID=UPI00036678CD|nr:LysE family transporter [Corynebacterium caspium]WKD58862.1 Threonine efflux protein [Corynebacterium caspium DSM 44850]